MNIYYLGQSTDLENLNFYDRDLKIEAIDDEVTVIDPNHLKHKCKVITFDYLIISNPSKLKDIDKLDLLIDEDQVIVTNFFLQSSQEHIFAINEKQNATEQLQKIVNFLLNIDF